MNPYKATARVACPLGNANDFSTTDAISGRGRIIMFFKTSVINSAPPTLSQRGTSKTRLFKIHSAKDTAARIPNTTCHLPSNPTTEKKCVQNGSRMAVKKYSARASIDNIQLPHSLKNTAGEENICAINTIIIILKCSKCYNKIHRS